jgi:hypothetical protein
MKFPKYVKCWSAKNKEGVRITEWVVRLYDEQMADDTGKKVKTPDELLNRYYAIISSNDNYISHLWEKKSIWLSFDELNKQ